MPKMGVNPEQTKAAKPVPAGWYKVKLKGITSKLSKSGKGFNYEMYGNVVENKPEFNDAFIYLRINNGFKQAMVTNDMCHGFGFPLENDGSIPGDFKLKPEIEAQIKEGKMAQDDPKQFDGAQYIGPLLGKVAEMEVVIGNWEGVDRNEVKQIRCNVKDCPNRFPDIKHLTDVGGKK